MIFRVGRRTPGIPQGSQTEGRPLPPPEVDTAPDRADGRDMGGIGSGVKQPQRCGQGGQLFPALCLRQFPRLYFSGQSGALVANGGKGIGVTHGNMVAGVVSRVRWRVVAGAT